MDRGRRPPEAENRARQIRGKLVWHRTAALGFGRLRRPRRPRPRGKSVGNAKHTSTARRTHLKTATRARWHKQGQLLGEARHEPIGRGGGKPKGTRWGNATHHANAAKGNAAEPSLGIRAAHFNAAPRGNAQFSHQVGTFSRTSPSARIAELERRLQGDYATPNAAAPRLLGQRPSGDEYGDFHRTKPQKARRGGGWCLFLCRCKARTP